MAARGNPLAKVGLALGVLLALGVVGVVVYGIVGRSQPGNLPPEPPPGSRSGPGWEVRYNATLALARRGSTQTPLATLAEMLDEDQQRRNARMTINQGKTEVPDEVTARSTVLAALEAVAALHRQQPDLDLGPVSDALARLEQSPNIVLRTEAIKTRSALTTTGPTGG
jgi:hypothetical protein